MLQGSFVVVVTMNFKIPAILVAGTSGDGGKTMVSLGLVAALKRMGKKVSVFKKGPDYIDAAWLGASAGSTCRNLDLFLMKPDVIRQSFAVHSSGFDISVIEGNRGLHDGLDAEGSNSSAELAKLLGVPVILVVNATKSTRTLAAIVLGCKQLDPDLNLAGVILNKVAGKRHVQVATEAIERYCGVPVVGAIPKLKGASRIPGRHLGLLPVDEYKGLDEALEFAAESIEKHVDLNRVLKLSETAVPFEIKQENKIRHTKNETRPRIGVLLDGAFSFYYPDNLEALENAGSKIIKVHSLVDESLPIIDALYIGGGFPETHADRLVENKKLRNSIKKAADSGLPIYAECGGLMFLSEFLLHDGIKYPMCGVLPIEVEMHKKPQGHGYVEMIVDFENPFYRKNTVLLGHEFHYSCINGNNKVKFASVCAIKRGTGIGQKRDGLTINNVFACYTHLHALSTSQWAEGMVKAASKYCRRK